MTAVATSSSTEVLDDLDFPLCCDVTDCEAKACAVVRHEGRCPALICSQHRTLMLSVMETAMEGRIRLYCVLCGGHILPQHVHLEPLR